MRRGYDGAELRRIEEALRLDGEPACPVCGSALTLRRLETPRAIAYVRHRLWVQCVSCGRTGTVEGQTQ